MRASFTLAALTTLILAGCDVGPVFRVPASAATCDSRYLTWTGGLTFHVLNGPGDGTFLYAPEQQNVDVVDGYYDLKSGDFWWRVYYDDEAYRAEERATGFGTLWRDGDLDIAYDWRIRYPNETERTFAVREQRFGCDTYRRVADDTGKTLSIERGDLSEPGAYNYTRLFEIAGRQVTASGRLRSDYRLTETLDFEEAGTILRHERTGDVTGRLRHDFFQRISGQEIEGYWEVDRTTLSVDYDRRPQAGAAERWTYAINGSGDGTGQFTSGNNSCQLTFNAGFCQRSGCTSGSNGPCQPPYTPDAYY